MNGESRLVLKWSTAVAAVAVLLLVGGGITYLMLRDRGDRAAPTPPVPAALPTASTAAPAPSGGGATPPRAADVVVTLSQDAVKRAGIVLATARTGAEGATFRLPAVVQANAYKQVSVTPLVGGRVTRVLVELGQNVRRGQPLAEIFSPELAEAETRYMSLRAELAAHDRELQRTEKLVEIGAASRQELERLHAEHTAKLTGVESARSRLQLLGVPSAAIERLAPGRDVSATTAVPAPIAGVVTERAANTGLNVDPSFKMFTIVDLSTVWVVADAYEKDFSRIRVGGVATIATKAYPDVTLRGRVTYIDPQVDPETRTAKVRVELPNPGERLRLGMFADVNVVGEGGSAAARIPKNALQHVGNQTVVYVVNPKQPERFVEREVRLGSTIGDEINVVDGVEPGESVVSEGSFFVRAERDRLGLRSREAAESAGATGPAPAPRATDPANDLEVKVLVTEKGFEPGNVTVRAGTPAKITFLRTTDKTCATEVVFPSLNITRALPLNRPVMIEFTPSVSGDMAFVCGMNMLKGIVAVQPKR